MKLTNKENNISPLFCFNYHLMKKLSIGLGATNYRLNHTLVIPDDATVKIEIEKTRVTIPISYVFQNFSLGASFIYEKSTLSFDDSTEDSYKKSDNNFGYDLGLAYHFSDLNLIFAVDYKSKIKHSDTYLNSASEIGIGASWNIANTAHTFALDYKRINSSEIDIFKSDIIQDQDTFAVGYMYSADTWQMRLGYKYISDFYTNDDTYAALYDYIFPYPTTSHYTLGGSYQFNNSFSTDIALMYATYVNKTDYFDGNYVGLRTKNNPISISVGINYIF